MDPTLAMLWIISLTRIASNRFKLPQLLAFYITTDISRLEHERISNHPSCSGYKSEILDGILSFDDT